MAYTKFLYTTTTGRLCGGAAQNTPANPNGRKHIPLIYVPGGGVRGTSYGDITTTNGIDLVATYGYAQRAKNANDFGTFTPKGGFAGEGRKIKTFFTQISSSELIFPADIIIGLIKYIGDNYSDEVDMSMLCLSGESLGGGSIIKLNQDPTIRRATACNIIFCPWAANPSTLWTTSSLQEMSKDLPATYIFHSNSDTVAPVSLTYNFLNGINAFDPTIPISVTIFEGLDNPNKGLNGHQISSALDSYTNRGTITTKTITGDFWTNNTYQYEIMAMHTNNRFIKP